MKNGAFHAGHKLDHTGLANILDKAIDDVVAKLAMGHLAAAESQAGFYFIAFGQEADGLVFLRLVIVLVNSYRELDFFDSDDFLLLARSPLALFFFVEIPPVILDAADGRNSVRRNFHKIEPSIPGDSQGFIGRQNAKLLTVLIDNADFTRADALIDADKGLG